jgi:hypothetical protein
MRRGSCGQAFVETLVTLIFLLPLFLCAVYLANLHRAGHGAALAAREIAVAALHDPAGEVDPRMVRALQELAIPADSLGGELQQPQIDEVAIDSAPALVEKSADVMLLPAKLLGSGEFDLPSWQARSVTTAVSMGSTEALGVSFDLPVVLQEKLFFFVGHGAANGPDQVHSRTAALSVAGLLAAAATPLEAVLSVASIVEPALERLCIGRIEPDIVPEDRLSGSLSRPLDLRYQPC